MKTFGRLGSGDGPTAPVGCSICGSGSGIWLRQNTREKVSFFEMDAGCWNCTDHQATSLRYEIYFVNREHPLLIIRRGCFSTIPLLYLIAEKTPTSPPNIKDFSHVCSLIRRISPSWMSEHNISIDIVYGGADPRW